MMNPQGEALKVGFDGNLRLEFHGARVTSDAGLLAYRDLDEALGLFDLASKVLNDTRSGRNIQHDMRALFRQSVYSRLAGYEDVNDADRLSIPQCGLSLKNSKCTRILPAQTPWGVLRQRCSPRMRISEVWLKSTGAGFKGR